MTATRIRFSSLWVSPLIRAFNHPKMPIPAWAKSAAAAEGKPPIDWLVTLRHINAKAVQELPAFREHLRLERAAQCVRLGRFDCDHGL